MSSPFFSIIVPVYNVEKYLHQCVDSILNQSFADFEVILVDDGSPDNCPQICDHYAQKDPRVKVIHKPNGGVSSARNIGLATIAGEYVIFVDSDDWLEHTALEEIFAQISAGNEQLIVFGYRSVDEEGTPNNGRCSESNLELVGANPLNAELFWQLFSAKRIGSCCDKVFKSSLIQCNALTFDEGMTFCEDTEFVLRYLLAMGEGGCISICDKKLYNYMTFEHGSAVQKYNTNRWQSFERIFGYLTNYLNQKSHEIGFGNYIYSAVQFTIQSMYNSFPNISYSEFVKNSYAIFKSKYFKKYVARNVSIGTGLYSYIIKTGVPLFVWMYHRLSVYKQKLQR